MSSKGARMKIFFLAIIFLFGFAGCGGGNGKSRNDHLPEWVAEPEDMTVAAGVTYTEVLNGTAVDRDKPNSRHGDLGFLTCKLDQSACSFDIYVLSIGGEKYVDCLLSFTPDDREVCSVTLEVVDGIGAKIAKQINIAVQSIDISNCVPNPVDEGNAVSCTVSSDDGTPVVDPVNDTCGGAINGAGPWTYDFTPTEADGPGNCTAAVELVENNAVKNSELVFIDEVNVAPVITSSASTTATEDTLYTYNATATDADLPPNSLTWSLSSGNTCGGVIDAATGIYTFTPAGPIPPATCDLDIQVCDNGAPVLCDSELATINITAVNDPPSVSSSPSDATENTAYSYDITCADPESDTLTLTLSAGNSCGGTVTDNSDGTGTYSGWTPTEMQGGTSCVVGITCSDGQDPVNQNTAINIIEDNQPPAWNPAPSEIWVFTDEVHSANYGHADDPDIPQNTLTCSKTAQTCPFVITVSGSAAGSVDCNFSLTAPASTETCDVSVQVSDGKGGVISQTVAVHVESGPCILRVDAAATGTGTGFSWTNAFRVLQNAVDRAYSGCEVWVKEGTYFTGDLNPVLVMKDGVDMYGGFEGDENVLGDRPSPTLLSHSVIDGQKYGKHGVVGASNACFDGFKVQFGGNTGTVKGNGPPNDGGGMFNYDVSDLTIYNCIFSWNAAGAGGAISNKFSDKIYVEDCTFNNNRSYYGGGIRARDTSLKVYDCDFLHNTSPSYGGAMHVAGSNIGVYNSTFYANHAEYSGGAIKSAGDIISVDSCGFSGNYGENYGGAISTVNDNFNISNSYFYNNKGVYLKPGHIMGYFYYGHGGAIFSRDSTGEISNNILKGNFAFLGGAIYNKSGGAILLSNNLIVYNEAIIGGGLFLDINSQMTISNTTIANNQTVFTWSFESRRKAGGIYGWHSHLTISNSIIWGNYDLTSPSWFFVIADDTELPAVIYSDIWRPSAAGPWAGTGNINADPYFIGPIFFDTSTAEGTTDSFPVANASIYKVNDVLRIDYVWEPRIVTGISGNTITVDYGFSNNIPAGTRIQNWGPLAVDDYFEFVYNHHLSQVASGQSVTSPCVNKGSNTAANLGLNTRTTRTDKAIDAGSVDMGYHYPVP